MGRGQAVLLAETRRLVESRSLEQNSNLVEFFHTAGIYGDQVWMGLTRKGLKKLLCHRHFLILGSTDVNETWRWKTTPTKDLEFTAWSDGAPTYDPTSNQNCGTLQLEEAAGNWTDVDCTEEHNFGCMTINKGTCPLFILAKTLTRRSKLLPPLQ